MNTHRRRRVQVATTTDTVEISWDARQQLLDRIRGLDGAEDVITRFDAVGMTRPVKELGRAGNTLLLEATTRWLDQVKMEELPYGIWELRCALIEDRDAGF